MARVRLLVPAVLTQVVLLAACTGPQHILSPASPEAARIERLWWILFVVAAFVCVLVTLLLLIAVRASRRRASGLAASSPDPRWLVWGGGVVLPLAILFPLLIYSFNVGNAVFPALDRGEGALTIEVVGHQYWWEVRYPEYGITTANEIRIPAGRPVRFLLSAPDVIHSFWVPRLHGKIDMIPGRVSTHLLEASEPGRYRGQCAEYCGLSHALMAFWVEALPPAQFDDWVESRLVMAPEPAETEIARGREVFLAAGCASCHASRDLPLPSVLGTPGPDLSDLASRSMIAAGTLPNTAGNLERWIRDPERIKPGARMPPTPLADDQMIALVRYLESLR